MGGCALAGAALSLLLPETLGSMPVEVIEDCEKLGETGLTERESSVP